MKLKNNNVIQKIALILICLLIFNFVVPTHISNAGFGGVLFTPVKELFVTIADVALDVVDLGFTGEFKHVMWNMFDHRGGGNRFTGDDNNRSVLMSNMSPEVIFSNKVELLNVDFINPINENDFSVKNDSATTGLNSLRKTISAWYIAIRNLALVIMLSILVYVGIRIILCSVASEKAKYKQLLIDWVIGMCLLFMLHYLMSFSIMITEKITEMLSGATSSGISLQKEDIGTTYMLPDAELVGEGFDYKGENKGGASGGDKVEKLKNLTQYVRYYVDLRDLASSFTYLIIYIFLVAYTIMFAVRYMKRMVIVAFLTMIAPFVAMTYPIDKMTDGKAQAFNFWLREYIFNLLIQPFHLVLYTVLVGTSTELVRSNLIYALVAIGCLIPAEKLLKEMFGFNKAHTPPGLAGPALATAMANKLTGGARSLMQSGGSNKPSSGSSKDNGGNSSNSQSPRTKQDYNFGSFGSDPSDGLNGSSSSGSGEPAPETEGPEVGGPNGNDPGLNNGPDRDLTLDPNIDTKRLSDEEAYEQGGLRNELMNNNQNAELDAYMNSSAYGNSSNNSNSSDNINNINNSSRQTLGRKAGNITKTGLANTGKLIKHGAKTITKPKNLKKGARFVGRIGGAIGGGAAGLIAGSITGKPSMAFSAMAAGAMMGNKAGANAVDSVVSKAENIKNTGRSAIDSVANFKNEGLYGVKEANERQKQRNIERQKHDYIKNKENRKYFSQETGATGKELDQIMRQAAEIQSYSNKDMDNESVLAALETQQMNQDMGMSEEKAKLMTSMSAKMVNDEGWTAADFADEKSLKKINNRALSIIKRTNSGLNEEQQQRLANQVVDNARYITGDKKYENADLKKSAEQKITMARAHNDTERVVRKYNKKQKRNK